MLVSSVDVHQQYAVHAVFEDDPLGKEVKVDVFPSKQRPTESILTALAEWQILPGQNLASPRDLNGELLAGESCPRCLFKSDASLCPICMKDPPSDAGGSPSSSDHTESSAFRDRLLKLTPLPPAGALPPPQGVSASSS